MPNECPQFTATQSDFIVAQGDTVPLTMLNLFEDSEGDPVTVTLIIGQSICPDADFCHKSNADWVVSPTSNIAAGTYPAVAQLDDGVCEGSKASHQFNIIVVEANQCPTFLTAYSDIYIQGGQSYTFDA